MKNSKVLKFIVLFSSIAMFLLMLAGCQSGKKYDSPDAMIAEMTGTYQGSGEHSGDRMVIDSNNIIKFNIDDIFSEITDDDIFKERFPDENWDKFDIDALLSKSYIEITKDPTSVDIRKSSISGLWINKSGILYSQSKNGYPFTKISSDSDYPTSEMQEKFEEYKKYLQEYEISSIITEAENNLSEEQESLDSVLSSATYAAVASKSTASAETIAKCAFESMTDFFKYPRTATLDSYSTNPEYDSYGRVATLIVCTTQNGWGNYVTEDVYVVLQSCSNSGQYSYEGGGVHYTKNGEYFKYILAVNGWDTDPNCDSTKEPIHYTKSLMKK